ncbi:MAG: porin family protein, partial [Thioalkalivibrio sp.]|nr:porin family protein [Thioalkalivibrio sp.]
MRKLIACTALAAALFGGTSAIAADGSAPLKNQIYIAPSLLFLGDDDEADTDVFIAPQIGIGGQFTDRLALEAVYGAGQTELTGNRPSEDVDIDFYRLDGLYTLGELGASWKPYVVGGVGRYTIERDNGGRVRDTQLNAGMGLM